MNSNRRNIAAIYRFEQPLKQATIVARPNRFIMHVAVDGKKTICHCPSTGKIAGIKFNGETPCLLSPAVTLLRKTPFTVEAIYIDKIKQWVGINQNAANRYIEYFFKIGALKKIVRNPDNLQREQTIGKSRLDFRIGNTYIEVKMPLQFLPSISSTKDLTTLRDSKILQSRFMRHLQELKQRLNANEQARLLICFMYDAPTFIVPHNNTKQSRAIKKLVTESVKAGVTIWQVNLEITPQGVKLLNYFNISNLFCATSSLRGASTASDAAIHSFAVTKER